MSHEDVPSWIFFALLAIIIISWTAKEIMKERKELLQSPWGNI